MSKDYTWDGKASNSDDNKKPDEVMPHPDQTSILKDEVPMAPDDLHAPAPVTLDPSKESTEIISVGPTTHTPIDEEPVEVPAAEPEASPEIISLDPATLEAEEDPLTTLYSDPTETDTPEDDDPLAFLNKKDSEAETPEHEEEVTNTTKAKILASIAIVIVAGYVAYWVQEPVQIRADVTGEITEEETATDDSAFGGETVMEDTALVAEAEAATAAPTGETVNVDVSLFGFEPATLQIDKDTIVIWTNTSTEEQTIIGSSDEGQSFVSPVLTSGDTFTYKFMQDATFEYYSTYNPALKASILVGSLPEPVVTEAPLVDSIENPVPEETTATPESAPVTADATPFDEGAAANETLEAAIAARDFQITSPADGESEVLTTGPTTTPATVDALHAAAPVDPNAPDNLSETGPAEIIYTFGLLSIAWLNRKKLYKAFSR